MSDLRILFRTRDFGGLHTNRLRFYGEPDRLWTEGKMADNKKSTPGASGTFEEGAMGSPDAYKPTYYGDDTLPKKSPSYKVYTSDDQKAGDATSGVIKSQSDGQSRALPKSEAVTDAKVEDGTTVRCAKKQTGLNRYPINEHVEKKKEYGPNN